jgi:hypothetical protein
VHAAVYIQMSTLGQAAWNLIDHRRLSLMLLVSEF